MFKSVEATTVQEYLDAVPADRKEMILFLHNFIQETVPSLKPHFATNMIGYGSFPYTNYKKESIEWPTVAMANQKGYISIYICSIMGGEYVAEKYKSELGNVSVGKSCIRFKKLEDLDLEGFKKVLLLAEKNPGLVLEKK